MLIKNILLTVLFYIFASNTLYALTGYEEQNLYQSFNNKNRKIIEESILKNSQNFYLGHSDEKANKILIDKLNYNEDQYKNYYTYTFLFDSNFNSSNTDYKNSNISNLYIENKHINFGVSTDNKNLSFGFGLSTTFISSKDNTESIYTVSGQNFSLNFFTSYHYENFFYISSNLQSNMSKSEISRTIQDYNNLGDIQNNSSSLSLKLGTIDYITKSFPVFINPYFVFSANQYNFADYQENNQQNGVGYKQTNYQEITQDIGLKVSYKYQINYRKLVKYVLTDISFNYHHINPLNNLSNDIYLLSNPAQTYSINSYLINNSYSTTLNITTGSNKYITKVYLSYEKNKELTSIITGFLISYYFM